MRRRGWPASGGKSNAETQHKRHSNNSKARPAARAQQRQPRSLPRLLTTTRCQTPTPSFSSSSSRSCSRRRPRRRASRPRRKRPRGSPLTRSARGSAGRRLRRSTASISCCPSRERCLSNCVYRRFTSQPATTSAPSRPLSMRLSLSKRSPPFLSTLSRPLFTPLLALFMRTLGRMIMLLTTFSAPSRSARHSWGRGTLTRRRRCTTLGAFCTP